MYTSIVSTRNSPILYQSFDIIDFLFLYPQFFLFRVFHVNVCYYFFYCLFSLLCNMIYPVHLDAQIEDPSIVNLLSRIRICLGEEQQKKKKKNSVSQILIKKKKEVFIIILCIWRCLVFPLYIRTNVGPLMSIIIVKN